MQVKRIEFSSKIDVQMYGFFRFELTTLDKQNNNVEISVDYGASDESGIITANVWARIVGGNTKSFLYPAKIDQAVVTESGYAGLAKIIHNSPAFRDSLKSFLDWAYQNHI